jgi:hypothetical protein
MNDWSGSPSELLTTHAGKKADFPLGQIASVAHHRAAPHCPAIRHGWHNQQSLRFRPGPCRHLTIVPRKVSTRLNHMANKEFSRLPTTRKKVDTPQVSCYQGRVDISDDKKVSTRRKCNATKAVSTCRHFGPIGVSALFAQLGPCSLTSTER